MWRRIRCCRLVLLSLILLTACSDEETLTRAGTPTATRALNATPTLEATAVPSATSTLSPSPVVTASRTASATVTTSVQPTSTATSGPASCAASSTPTALRPTCAIGPPCSSPATACLLPCRASARTRAMSSTSAISMGRSISCGVGIPDRAWAGARAWARVELDKSNLRIGPLQCPLSIRCAILNHASVTPPFSPWLNCQPGESG